MASRRDFYFRQLVMEDELDGAFAGLEDADRQVSIDQGMVGIAIAMAVAQEASPNLHVQVSGPGVCYDQAGQRIAIPTTQHVDCSVDEDGLTTTVTTPGRSKKLAVFAEFDRILSDPRVDGNGDTINFDRDEGFKLNVVQSAEAISPTLVPLRSDQILLADITIAFGATTIVTGDISTTRRQDTVRQSGTYYGVIAGTAREAAISVLTGLNLLATDLADTTASSDGAAMIGTQTSGNLSGATVRAQLTELDNEKVAKAGDTMTGDLTLATTKEVLYSGGRTKVIRVAFAAAIPGMTSAGATQWWLDASATPPVWTNRVASSFLLYDLTDLLTTGQIITQVRAVLDPSTAQATAGNRMQIQLCREIPDFATPAQGSRNAIASQTDDGTANVQVVSIAPAHTVDKSAGGYYLQVRSSNQASGDFIYNVEMTVTDPGPRNY